MKTGFLIVNYNDYETTEKLLSSIKDYSCLDKIIVVDNKSTDKSYTILREKYQSDKISIIQNSENKGYASGMNFGSKYLIEILGDCNIIISNADIEISSENRIIKLVQSKPENCAIIAPTIRELSGLNRGWRVPTPFQDILLNIVYIHKFLKPKLLLYEEGYYNSSLVEVEVVSGCFFIIDSMSLKEVNFFDDYTFLYYEENIIAKKLEKINKKTFINSTVEVYHNHSVSIDKSINHLNKYKELKKSQYYFQKKYNKAGFISRFLMKITVCFSFQILKISQLVKK